MSSLQRFIITCLFSILIFGKAGAADRTLTDVQIPPDCYDIILPDTAPYALFITDDKGFMKYQKILVKSLSSGKELWSIPFKLNLNGVYAHDFGIIVYNGKQSILYDYASGKKLFKMKAKPAFIDDSNKILVGYQGESNDKLVAYDLTSGKQLWKRKIDKNLGYPWDKVVSIDSNTAIYSGGDLWKLDISTGECHSYKVKRHIFDKEANAGTATLGLLSAFVGGTFIYSPSYFSDLGSNVLTDTDGRLYVADRDALSCVDTTLNIMWRTTLPDKSGSKSYIRLVGDTLKLLNTGQAMTGERVRKLGDAFIASYNKKTGELYKMLPIAKEWDKDDYGEQLDFITRPLYAFDYEKEVISQVDYPEDSFPIIAMNGDVSIVDNNLTELKRYPLNDLFYKIEAMPQGTALIRVIKTPATEVVILNEEGKITDSMEGTAPLVQLHDGHIVTIYNGSLVIHQ